MNDHTRQAATHERPCSNCRKRKIRCDKVQPCNNCQRIGKLCSYDDVRLAQRDAPVTTGTSKEVLDLRARLARLEQDMARILHRVDSDSGAHPDSAVAHTGDGCVANASAQDADPPTGQVLSTTRSDQNQDMQTEEGRLGQLIFKDGYCAYFSVDFWVFLIEEIEPDDLRDLVRLRHNQSQVEPWLSAAAMGQPIASLTADGPQSEPTLEQSNLLFKHFFSDVNPFTRILHTAHFGRLLGRYRRDASNSSPEARALIFSMYALTISTMSSEAFEARFHSTKSTWLTHFQTGAQRALVQSDFGTSDSVFSLMALLHYLTLLYHQHRYSEAVAMLGIATHIATRMGYHRDPEHFPLHPWVSELRRRAWSQICCIKAMMVTSCGADPNRLTQSDTKPPLNSDDSRWCATQYAGPKCIPSAAERFTDMTFALVHRQLADMVCRVSQLDAWASEEKDRLITETEHNLNQSFFRHMDRAEPAHAIVFAFAEDRILSQRLVLRHRDAVKARTKNAESMAYTSALELLENLKYHCRTFAARQWDWIFKLEVPWLAIAMLLTYDCPTGRQSDFDRSEALIQAHFEDWSAHPVTATANWATLVKLRERSFFRRTTTTTASGRSAAAPAQPQAVLSHNLFIPDVSETLDSQPDDEAVANIYQYMPWLTEALQIP